MQADRRFEFACGLAENDDYAAAIDLLEQTREITPDWAVLSFTLGKYYKALDDTVKAQAFFTLSMEQDPTDTQGAALELERLGVNAIDGNMPPAFVETLFDQYAEHFDEHLVVKLDYAVPEMIADAAAQYYNEDTPVRVLDLGCGTGLAGEHLKPLAASLTGVDLSSGMLEQAAQKNIYDDLIQGELVTYLEASTERFELIVAADVLSYFGALEEVLSATKKQLKPNGHFIFSVQALASPPPDPDQPDYYLCKARRFSHAAPYLRRTLAETGLKLNDLQKVVLRKDEGNDVNGYIIVCQAT